MRALLRDTRQVSAETGRQVKPFFNAALASTQ